jgi:1-acyl-sn-glycerol-3-phosphate acyltransferase
VAYWVLKGILTPIFYVLWRVKVEGRENIPTEGPAVLAANHQSFCDSFFIPLVVRRKVTYLAKAEYFDSWRTAWFFRAVGQIPIRRSGGDASERALATAREVLGVGHVLGVYPEGTRSPNDCVHKGRTGVARLAFECQVPVVPVGIVGTTDVQPVGHRLWRPGRRVTVRFGAPMRVQVPDGAGEVEVYDALRAFTDHLMHEIARLSGRPYLDEYVPARAAVGSSESSSLRNRPFTQSA